MAANTGFIQGQDLVVYVGANPIAHSTSCVFTPSVETRPRISKDTGGFNAKVAGLSDWEVSADALACYDGHSYFELLALLQAKDPVTIKFSGRPTDSSGYFTPEAVGDKYIEASGIITQLPLTAPNNADATFSITIAGAAEFEIKTKSA